MTAGESQAVIDLDVARHPVILEARARRADVVRIVLLKERFVTQRGKMEPVSLEKRLFDVSHLSGAFELRSGAIDTEYFDKYRFESDPVLLADVADALKVLVPSESEMLAGLELGGVPLAVALSAATGLPAVFVRKVAKPYGTCKICEGGDVSGRHLLIIEDVVTSAGQAMLSARELRAEGAEVTDAICVIDREAGGGAALSAIGIRLRSLTTTARLKAAAGVI